MKTLIVLASVKDWNSLKDDKTGLIQGLLMQRINSKLQASGKSINDYNKVEIVDNADIADNEYVVFEPDAVCLHFNTGDIDA